MNLKLFLIPETDDHQSFETSTVWFYKYPKQKDLLNSQWWKKGGNDIPGKENWPWSAENILSWHPYHAKWRPNQEMSPTLNMAKLRKSRKQSRLWTSRDLNTKLRREKIQHPKNMEKHTKSHPLVYTSNNINTFTKPSSPQHFLFFRLIKTHETFRKYSGNDLRTHPTWRGSNHPSSKVRSTESIAMFLRIWRSVGAKTKDHLKTIKSTPRLEGVNITPCLHHYQNDVYGCHPFETNDRQIGSFP